MAEVRIMNMSKRFGEVEAVKNLTLTIEDGEFLVLLGPSGCGKTTTLRSVAGLEHPEEGDIYIGQRRVNDLSPADRDIAMVFQFYALYPHLSAYDNIAFPLRAQKTPKDEVDRKVHEAARLLRIEHTLPYRPSQLSIGEQQRVALGRALVREPSVFLMDEPLTNLDAKLRVEMRAELKHLQRRLGTTMIYVTHDQTEAMSMGQRIAVMNLGELQQVDTPLEVYDHPATLFVAGFIGSPPMNFIQCTLVEEEGQARLKDKSGHFSLKISHELKSKIVAKATGPDLILGIRSENVHLYREEHPDSIPVPVHVCEPLGDEIIYGLRVGENIILAKTPPTFDLEMESRVWMHFDQSRMHLFDKKSEKAII